MGKEGKGTGGRERKGDGRRKEGKERGRKGRDTPYIFTWIDAYVGD